MSQTLQRMQTPMLSNAAQGAIRATLFSEEEADKAPSRGRDRDRLLETIEKLDFEASTPPPSVEPVKPTPPPTENTPISMLEQDPLFEPLPGTDTAPLTTGFDPSQSAIVLPRADDRELAVRLRGPLGGIASLAG